MLPMIWCQPAEAGMSSYRKFLTALSRPVRCSSQSITVRIGVLSARLHGPDLQLAALDPGHEAIQRARRGAAQDLSVHGKDGAMAGANEGMARVVPMIRASQMRTLRSEGNHFVVGLLHHPGGGFLGSNLPTIHARALEGDLGGSAAGNGG